MGKKTRTKKNGMQEKGLNDFKFKFHSFCDSLHEGRIFSKRKTGVWSTFNSVNRLCSEAEKEESLSDWGEKV